MVLIVAFLYLGHHLHTVSETVSKSGERVKKNSGELKRILFETPIKPAILLATESAKPDDSDPRLQTKTPLRQGFTSAGCHNGHQNGHQFFCSVRT